MKKEFERCSSVFLFMLVAVVMGGLLSGCENNKTGGSGIAVLDIEQAMDNVTEVKMSSYFSAIEYVPLETNHDVLITDASWADMYHSDDRFYIINKSRVGPAFTKSFDYSGKNLPFRALPGRAVGEYLSGLSLLPYDGGVYMVDVNSFIKYDNEGNYLSSIPVDNGLFATLENRSALINDRLILIREDAENMEDLLSIYDNNDKLLLEERLGKYEMEAKMANIGAGGSSILVHSRARFINLKNSSDKAVLMGYNDTIYYVNEEIGELIPAYVPYLGKYDIGKDSPNIRAMFLETPAFTLYRVIFNVDGFPNLSSEDRISTCLYDRATGKNMRMKRVEKQTPEQDVKSAWGFVNDLDGGMQFTPSTVYGDKMYQLVNAYQFIEYAHATGSRAMLDVAAKLDEESNPVLVMATLK